MIWIPVAWVALTVITVTLLSSIGLLKITRRYKIQPKIRIRDVHTNPTPRLGGIAMYLGLLAGLGVAYLFPALRGSVYPQGGQSIFALIAAATVMAVTGLIDDIKDLPWYLKLPGETIAALILVIPGGLRFTQAPTGDLSTIIVGYWPSIIITVLIILITINMMNFIDGLDGLVAGIAIIAGGTYLIYCAAILYRTTQSVDIITAITVTAIICAFCIGFLPVNWHPAKMFMGDTGSMLIGLLFAATAILVSQGVDPTQAFAVGGGGQYSRANLAPAFLPVILPLVVLIVPLADFTLAISRRLIAGKSPFTADRKHLHHRLLDMGHTPMHATLIFYALTLVISGGSLLFLFSTQPVAWAVIGGGIMFCAVLTLLPLSRRKRTEVAVQTTPIKIITPEMLAMDPLDRAGKK